MLSARLIQLIETHSDALTRETMEDIATNERTRSFRVVPTPELKSRVFAIFHNLGKWITGPDHEAVRLDFEAWGRTRFRQGIPLSEIVYSLILLKSHLRRYIREHGLVELHGEHTAHGELLPVELYSIQELNYLVGEFFDRALYHLARGYEAEAALHRAAA
jgi:hypothetical protein